MVLEELKKAETLIELLRNSGFKNASKPLRPEHFDQEFGDRHYAAVLNALLCQLDRVTLNPHEVAKLERLAAMGLLEGIDFDTFEEVETVSEAQREELDRMTAMNALLEETLEEQNMEIQRLTQELPEKVSPESDTQLRRHRLKLGGSNRSLLGIIDLEQDFQKCAFEQFERVMSPLEDPRFPHESYRNDEIISHRRSDNSEYLSYLRKALSKLQQIPNMEPLIEEDFLHDDRILTHLSDAHIRRILQSIIKWQEFYLSLSILLLKHEQFQGDRQAEFLSSLQEEKGKLEFIVEELSKYNPLIKDPPQSKSECPSNETTHASIKQINSWLHEADDARKNLSSLAAKYLDETSSPGHIEVNPIPGSVRGIETELREISLKMSSVLQKSLEYNESRAVYTEILQLVRRDDLSEAWKLCNSLLDGELFAEGPKHRYQPSTRDLQRNTLIMAHDLGKRMDKSAALDLALESVSWFPEEAIFWLNLADALKGGDFREMAARRLALKKALTIVPNDFMVSHELEELEHFLLGTPSRFTDPKFSLPPPLSPKTVHQYSIKLSADSTWSFYLEKLNLIAEDAFELHNRKAKNAIDDPQVYRGMGSALVKITRSTEASNIHNSAKMSDSGDESAPTLSQTPSIKTFDDFTDNYRAMRGSRRARGRSDVLSGQQMDVSIDYLLGVLQLAFADHGDSAVDQALEFAKAAKHQSDNRTNKFSLMGDDHDPINMSTAEGTVQLRDLLFDSIKYLSAASADEKPSETYFKQQLRLVGVVCSRLLEDSIEYLDATSLVWLAEMIEDVADYNESFSHIVPLILLKVRDAKVDLPVWFRALRVHAAFESRSGSSQSYYELKSLLKAFPVYEGSHALGGEIYDKRNILSSPAIDECLAMVDIDCSVLEFLKVFDAAVNEDEMAEIVNSYRSDCLSWFASIFSHKESSRVFMAYAEYHKTVHVTAWCLAVIITLSHRDKSMNSEQFAIAIKREMLIWPNVIRDDDMGRSLLENCFSCPEALSSLIANVSAMGLWKTTAEFLLVTFREVVLSCKDEKRINSILSKLLPCLDAQPDVSNLEDPLFVLQLSMLRLASCCPDFGLQDRWFCLKKVTETKLKNVPWMEPKLGVKLFNMISGLVNLEDIQPDVFASFYNIITAVTKPLLDDPALKLACSRLKEAIETRMTINMQIYPVSSRLQSNLSFMKALYDIKASHSVIPSSKKRSSGDFSIAKDTLITRILIEPDKGRYPDLLWELAKVYESELAQIMNNSEAFELVDDSQDIAKLITAAFNCFMFDTVFEIDADASRVACFLRSVISGVLAMFRDASHLSLDRLVALSIAISKKYLHVPDMLRLAISCMNNSDSASPVQIAQLLISSLLDVSKVEKPPTDQLYFLFGNLIPKLQSDSMLNRTWDKLMEIVAKLPTIFSPVDPNVSHTKQLLIWLDDISKMDKKRVHHLHIYAEVTVTENASERRAAWSKIFPILTHGLGSKSKVPPLVQIWQNELDFPGDYFYYMDRYFGLMTKELFEGHLDGDVLERARMLSMILGRMLSSPGLFIRRRFHATTILKYLASMAAKESSANGLNPEFDIVLDEAKYFMDKEGLI